jgi:hypothetical protein
VQLTGKKQEKGLFLHDSVVQLVVQLLHVDELDV